MTAREALAAALAKIDADTWPHGGRPAWSEAWDDKTIVAAARERLAQLPEPCGVCAYRGRPINGCPTCNGTGTVYPQEAIDQAFAVIKSLTDPRYVVYSEWQLGGAAIHEQDEDDRMQWL